MNASKIYDFSGLICPLPVLKLRRAIAQTSLGDSLVMISTDANAEKDVMQFCQQHGHLLLDTTKQMLNQTPRWHFTIQKGE